MSPKSIPFAAICAGTLHEQRYALLIATIRIACSSRDISRASISIGPEPNKLRVIRSLTTSGLTESLTGVDESAMTKTFVAKSPPPPGRGRLWQEAQECESGPVV